jgi:hypothetical protein
MTAGRGDAAVAAAQQLVGRRVRLQLHGGEIVGIGRSSNGFVRYVVRWDAGTPSSWATVVAPGASGLVVEPEPEP